MTQTRVLDLENMSLSELTAAYNAYAGKNIGRFKNITGGRAKLQKVLEAREDVKALGGLSYEGPDLLSPDAPVTKERRGRQPLQTYVAEGITDKSTVHVLNKRDFRPGSLRAATMDMLSDHDGVPVVQIVDQLPKRWGSLRSFLKKGLIEIRAQQ